MASNAWNIENVELSEPTIFNELVAEYGEYILTAPEVGFDD